MGCSLSNQKSSMEQPSSSTPNPIIPQNHPLFSTLEEVTEAFRKTLGEAALDSFNLILGIDFTKSNEWTGANSFQRKYLHHIGHHQNPYEQVLSMIGGILSSYHEDKLISCFGFGDASTRDQEVFNFHVDDGFFHGIEQVLSRYRELVPQLRLSGPRSFGPIIEMGITKVMQSEGRFNVLLIIANGQVTGERGQVSTQERKTVEAIMKASEYPLAIILVGVGDGPWDTVKEFYDSISPRAFHNLQFVNFTEIMSTNVNQSKKEADFAVDALLMVPYQYQAVVEQGILSRSRRSYIHRIPLSPPQPLPPPQRQYDTSFYNTPITSKAQSHNKHGVGMDLYASSSSDNQRCPICLSNLNDMVFGCGHQTCCDCGQDLDFCPICGSEIETRISIKK